MTTASLMPSRVIETFVNSRHARVAFDPTAVEHREAFLEFRKTGKWKTKLGTSCPFKLEWPFLTVPALCQGRLLDYYLTQDSQLHK
jgi:hypothetical protein